MGSKSAKEILHLRVELSDYWREAHRRMDTLISVYHGNYQELWPDEFRRGEVPKIVNWIKLGWDRYATMVGKLPKSHVPPSRLRRVSQTKADKVEKILSHYDYSSGMARMAKWYSWYLIGLGASCIGVMPDPTMKGPRYFVKDPRTVLPAPGAGSVPTTSNSYGFLSKPSMTPQSLAYLLMSETVTADFLLHAYSSNADRIRPLLKGSNINTPQELITFMEPYYWCILVNGTKVVEVETPFEFVPARFTTMHVPDQLGGQSQFEQNIGMVLAYMRIMNQKLTYNTNLVWPWLVVRGLNEIDHQNRVIEIMDREGMAEFLHPPAELQAERDMEMLDRLIRVMNRDTEVFRGEPPGSVVTGAGARELNRDVQNAVLDYWENMAPDYEFVRSSALVMDQELYSGVTKPMFGRVKGEQFEEEYTPGKHIKGHTHVVADFGIGVGGMEGFVELMQVAAQGYMDEQSVMEDLPWIQSVSETRRRVMLDRLEKIILEMVASGAPTALTNHLSEWHKAIEEGAEPWSWIAENPLPGPEEALGPEALLGPEGLPPEGMGPEGQPPGVPQPAGPSVPTPTQLMALMQGRGG